MIHLFSSGVAEQLGFYVYLYFDPFTDTPFYIGKGQGNRVFEHLEEQSETAKVQRIEQIRERGKEPKIELLVHGLPDEETALRIEAAAIDLLGIGSLTNQVRGWGSSDFGRRSVEEIEAYYARGEARIEEDALLIRVNQLFRPGMSALELYEITRGVWRIGERRHKVRYALAIYRGIVREVYRVDSWHRACSTSYETRNISRRLNKDRWEFVGDVAEETIRQKYLLKSVTNYFGSNWQTPYVYINC
ncbi:MAG TPA: hypothetical protein VGB77_18620 [Abditibacteriaceae bacterium]|jgi:hypothetical protein